MADEQSPRWAEFRRINRTAILWLAVGFPSLVPSAILLKTFLPLAAPIAFALLAAIWIVGFVIFGFRFARFRCPRCHNKFFAHQGLELAATRRCSSCGLGLYANE